MLHLGRDRIPGPGGRPQARVAEPRGGVLELVQLGAGHRIGEEEGIDLRALLRVEGVQRVGTQEVPHLVRASLGAHDGPPMSAATR
jgi:hypothetical protein